MAISRAMRVGAMKQRAKKRKKLADLAQGKQDAITATPARFLSPYRYVSDFEYIEDGDNALIEDAQRRLMWGRRLESSSPSFIEQVVLLEQAIERAKKPKVAVVEETKRRWELTVEGGKAGKRSRRSDFGVARGPRVPQPLPTTSQRQSLRNRTREERIADLRAALARQS